MAQQSGRIEKKKLCFVIGPIGKDGSSERKHADLLLNTVVREGVHISGFDLDIKRADGDSDPGMIGDRIISDIINSELVIADLTDLNPNVFYELGIRHSTQKPTIHMSRNGTVLPFDNISHRTIFVDLADWESIVQARSKLSESIKIALSVGYKPSNPITQANASFRMRTSDDPIDRTIAQMQERFSTLESRINRREREEELIYTEELLGKRDRLMGGSRNRNLGTREDFELINRYVENQKKYFIEMTNADVADRIERYATNHGIELMGVRVTDDAITIDSGKMGMVIDRSV